MSLEDEKLQVDEEEYLALSRITKSMQSYLRSMSNEDYTKDNRKVMFNNLKENYKLLTRFSKKHVNKSKFYDKFSDLKKHLDEYIPIAKANSFYVPEDNTAAKESIDLLSDVLFHTQIKYYIHNWNYEGM